VAVETPLARLLNARSVAVVGASDNQIFSQGFTATLSSGLEIFMVNPRHPAVFGIPTVASLRDIGHPVDAVLSLVSADRSLDVLDDAIEIGAGGIVIVAAGFAELPSGGTERQERLVRAATNGGIAVCGPNGTGLINMITGANLCITPPTERKRGSVALVSASGGMLAVITSAANERGIGFSYLISAGNEAVTGTADYLDFLADDPNTRAICLLVESIRDPAAFFTAAAKAHDNGKPIIALKLGRTEQARRIARSHTGALVKDNWVYEMALRQAGVQLASDIDDLMDRVALFDHYPAHRWVRGSGTAVLTSSGGGAGLLSDIAADEGVELPPLDDLAPFVSDLLPGITVPNPLDLTGYVVAQPELFRKTMDKYLEASELDTLLMIWGVNKEAELMSSSTMPIITDVARSTDKLVVLTGLNSMRAAPWIDDVRDAGVAIGYGPRPTLRALATMHAFMRRRDVPGWRPDLGSVPTVPRPGRDTVDSPLGQILAFDDCMQLLRDAGIPTAPYAIVEATATADPGSFGFPGPYVVKLADVAHRTEANAVRVGVPADQLDAAVAEMRGIAARLQAPARVVIQPQVEIWGEAFVGAQPSSDLGPFVVCGLGGVMVELLHLVTGRLAPLSGQDADDMLDELAPARIFDGYRGAPAWDRAALADIVGAAGRLAVGARGWLESVDVNPLAFGPYGFLALDGLAVVAGAGTDSHQPADAGQDST
jgi:acetate---CoA ligase (ADP-forming)